MPRKVTPITAVQIDAAPDIDGCILTISCPSATSGAIARSPDYAIPTGDLAGLIDRLQSALSLLLSARSGSGGTRQH